MKTYRSFATNLLELLGKAQALRIISDGFMPLSIEDIGVSADGQRLIALSHTAEQNGDLMRDPEMVFAIHDWQEFLAAEPLSFRNDFMGIMQEVYRYDDQGKRTHVVPRLKAELKSFARMWFRNLRAQGFFDNEANRERLA